MIVLVLNSLSILNPVGGAERSTHSTSVALRKMGCKVYLLAFTNDRAPGVYRRDGVIIVLYRLPNIYWPFNTLERPLWRRCVFHVLDLINPVSLFVIASVVYRVRPSVVWTNMLKGWSCGAWYLLTCLRIPVCATLREFDMLYGGLALMLHPDSPSKPFLIWRVKAVLSWGVDSVVGISRDILSRFRSNGFFRVSSSSVIGNPMASSRNAWKSRRIYGAGRDPLRVGWLGRFAGEKGLDRFLGAVDLLAGSANLEFHIAGDGDSTLKAEVVSRHDRQRIKYWGFCDSVDFLSYIDVLIVSSLAPEPFGRVVIEAFQQRCYVISTGRGGLSEVNRNPSCGAIYDGSVHDLTAKIIWARDKLEFPSSGVDFEREEAKYQPDVIASKYKLIFTGLVSKYSGLGGKV